MPLEDFYNKIVAIQEFDIIEETITIINQNSELLKSMLQGQLKIGKDGDNEPVTIFGRTEYSFETFVNKKQISGIGGITEWITNYMSGSFYSLMRLKTSGIEFNITSDVEYYDEIINRSGSVIMELNKENLEEFSTTIVIPQLQKRFTEVFNGL